MGKPLMGGALPSSRPGPKIIVVSTIAKAMSMARTMVTIGLVFRGAVVR